jgi:ubiquinone/menaquinone biosynthesis C-methylase UbiE
MKRVDYDQIAATYDERAKLGYLSAVSTALQKLARQLNAARVLDLGCGTGRSLAGLAQLQPAPVCFGLDLSGGMLARARGLNSGYRLAQAPAHLPPFAPARFDLITCVHAFHHFPHKMQVVQAAYALLRPGGALAIINMDPRESRQEWLIYKYFEGAYDIDLRRFPSVAQQEAMLRQAGFRQVSSPVVERVDEQISDETIMDDYWLRKESSSQLILLSDEAYQAGLARIRAEVEQAQARGETVIFRTHLLNRMYRGFNPT